MVVLGLRCTRRAGGTAGGGGRLPALFVGRARSDNKQSTVTRSWAVGVCVGGEKWMRARRCVGVLRRFVWQLSSDSRDGVKHPRELG